MFTSFQRSVDVSFSQFFFLSFCCKALSASFSSLVFFVYYFFFVSFFDFIHSFSQSMLCSERSPHTHQQIHTHTFIREDMNKRILKQRRTSQLCIEKKAKRTSILHTYVSSVFEAVEDATTFALHLFYSEHAMNDQVAL